MGGEQGSLEYCRPLGHKVSDVTGLNGERDTENRFMDMGRGEERVRCMERVTWKLTLHSQREFAVWLRKLKQGL